MILVGDGGSSKTDWRLIAADEAMHSFQTMGINPLFASDDDILQELSSSGLAENAGQITDIHFYGAGLATREIMDRLSALMQRAFPRAGHIKLYDDMTAAARALFRHGEGIACILGTGSNSCLYKNGTIVDKVPALGYTLGDEGSGASIGRKFINALYKRQFSQELSERIIGENQLDTHTLFQKVYAESYPNRYLASLTQIIIRYIDHKEVLDLVSAAFEEFIEKNIRHYNHHEELRIGFVGSVAYYFKDILMDTLRGNKLIPGPVLKSPIEKLSDYHLEIYKQNNNPDD